VIAHHELLRVLTTLVLLLAVAHGVGALFALLQQPKVIGEIVGGLLLGPTVLGALWPEAMAWLFDDSAARATIGTVGQIGLFLLMFCSGIEARRSFEPGERRVVAAMSVTGLVIPFALGVAAVALTANDALRGPASTDVSFLLVFGCAIAVTSIPVISRIMNDLGVLETGFARIVLGVAIVEDIILYVVLAVAVGLTGADQPASGLPALMGLTPGSLADIVYHVGLSVGLLVAAFVLAPPVNRWIGAHPAVKGPISSTSRRLVFLFVVVVVFLVLDLEAFLGAFLAGTVVGMARRGPDSTEDPAAPRHSDAHQAIRRFAYAFFIPCYFALVGANLDLGRGLAVGGFVGFFAFACGAKAFSVYLGGRLAGMAPAAARNLSVALNARGGPGIVLASITFAAGIISNEFFTWLVLLAVGTSMIAGSFLQRLPRAAFENAIDDGGAIAPPSRTPETTS